MANGKKVTEIEQVISLTGVSDVYVKKGDAFHRVPLSIFFAGCAGLPEGFSEKLIACLQQVKWIDPVAGPEAYQDLYDTLFPEEPTVPVSSISATFDQGETVVYDDATLSSLKSMLTVVATFSDTTTATITSGYSLSGTLSEGTSTITVIYGEKTATFTVDVTHRMSLDDIAYGTTTYRDMFITNNLVFVSDFEMPLTLTNSYVSYGTNQYYKINAGSPSISADAYNSPSHSLKAFGSGSAQILIKNEVATVAAGKYLIGACVSCSRFSAGRLGLQINTPLNGPVEADKVGATAVTDGFEAVGSVVTVAANRTSYGVFIGSMNSANLDGYLDDPIFIPIPSNMTEEAAMALYENYLSIRRAA